MAQLPDSYNHKEREKFWQDAWLASGVYHWDESQPRANTYVIDTPPPTVSGVLHMGHIFSYTQADFIARYQRMSGKTVFYPMGFDDNGLPTERLVEKTQKIRAVDMTREEFIKRCESVAEEARVEFRKLFQSAALSVDWRQEYSTISNESRKISQLSFLDLYRKNHVYRALQPMLWDPVDQTAIAQAEVVDKEISSFFNDIKFNVEETGENIIIGTTRPELIPACVAVFYHPDDARYQHLKGKTAITPLFGVKVPILADDAVKLDKGTGLVMCCTFGDETDILWWRKHNLPTRIVLNKYGKLNIVVSGGKFIPPFNAELMNDTLMSENALKESVTPEQFIMFAAELNNLKATAAREKVLELLKESNLLVKQEPITHAVKCAERSGAPLEILPTYQWFVKVLDKKNELKAKAAECRWYPEWMKVRMDQWIDGLNWDWCISRQRYFGVPFPVWYSKRPGEEGKILVAEPDQLPVNPLKDLPKGYSKDEVEPEADVMDTWATSSVSPQINAGGINQSSVISRQLSEKNLITDNRQPITAEQRYAKLFPADLRPQAHEIIRTWAFYTLVKAYLHEGKKPWENVMISGWCLAPDKTKMSKSKGNVITPVELIEDKGTDAVRYWASTSKLGTDTAFSEDLLKIGKKLVTKLWNATKFVSMQLEHLNGTPTTAQEDVKKGMITETLDLWILTRLHRAISIATKEYDRYEYSDARAAIEDFFWNDFCDNYLELVKGRAYEGDAKKRQSALFALHHCLNGILKLFAPIVPHITEELFSHMFPAEFKTNGSIHARGMWPQAENYPVNETAEKAGIHCMALLNAIRKAKSERNVSIKYPLDKVVIYNPKKIPAAELQGFEGDLKSAANAAAIEWSDAPPPADTLLTENGNFPLSPTFAANADVA